MSSGLSSELKLKKINEVMEIYSKSIALRTSDPIIDIPFVYGTHRHLIELDPQNSWDSGSIAVIDQVCEGLYGYNYSNPDTAIIPYLATDFGIWSHDGLNYTIPLRTGVTFHDGAHFNAIAVKFTFDRLAYLLDNHLSVFESNYYDPYHIYNPNSSSLIRIINRTEIVDLFTIKFVLNVPYGALDALLCFSGSYILSPQSTSATTLIDTDTGDLIGTGPFVYDGCIPNLEVNFHAFDDYWQGKADIDQMIFKTILDPTQLHLDLINEDVHFISEIEPEYFNLLDAIPYITFLDTGKTNDVASHIVMNNRQINPIFREATSFAIDYDYLINDIYQSRAERLKSPIPDGIRYANSTFNYPVLDLPYARTMIQSLGYGLGYKLYDDKEWLTAALNTPFATWNYTYYSGDTIGEKIFPLLKDSLAKIGIKTYSITVTYTEFLNMLYEVGGKSRNYLQLFWMEFSPDFNDPSAILNPFFTNRILAYNYAQFDDTIVQQWMEEALLEQDQAQRELIYDQIQKRLVEELYPYVWGTVEKLYYAHHANLTGFQPNTLEKLYFYPCQWDLSNSLTILLPDNTTSWEKGSAHYFYWKTTGSVSNITINLYNNDIFALEIVSNTSNIGHYYWTIPSTLASSTQYQIRISDSSNSAILDFSDYFEIKGPAATRPRVPGYNLFIIISVICLISVILLKNRRKKY